MRYHPITRMLLEAEPRKYGHQAYATRGAFPLTGRRVIFSSEMSARVPGRRSIICLLAVSVEPTLGGIIAKVPSLTWLKSLKMN